MNTYNKNENMDFFFFLVGSNFTKTFSFMSKKQSQYLTDKF